MNPAVYGSGFFWGYCLVHIVHAPAMLMDRGELVILGTVHHYHSLLFVRTFSILTVGVGSCLMAWERPLYGTSPVWVYFFQVQTEYIWSNTKVHRQKSPSVIFGRTNMYTERCPISIDTKNKKNGSLCGTQSTSCAMTQTGYTRANIREIHMRWQKINKMRVLFCFSSEMALRLKRQICNNGIVRNRS
jgi:hypothetical protein